ncbi:MAG: hypothetical protein GX946_03350 [Oligosphaeraceae bacterium]|nr:hypothetical protein [Oligosphaeraceae bacterium]
MDRSDIFSKGIQQLLEYKFSQQRMTGWFEFQEIKMHVRQEFADPDAEEVQAAILCRCIERMRLSIPPGSVIAGTQDDAFSPSYALINPAFRVETFAGYCDPVAIYDDLTPDDTFPQQRIEKVRSYYKNTPYVKALQKVYAETGKLTEEVAFFVEPVTGHTIPDLRPILKDGIKGQKFIPEAAHIHAALAAAEILAMRYADLAEQLMKERADQPEEVFRLAQIVKSCRRVPSHGATNLHEAVQSAALLWQAMTLEQAPNPYAFSVGNLDRILQPYLLDTSHDEAVQLVRAFLAFLMVGERCWAISQNIMVGGRDVAGNDLTTEMTYIVLDAFFLSNNPQPALSVKLHRNTPETLYQAMGRFFFTPGHSTPSFFNDDMVFRVLERKKIAEADWPDYSIAGCQEPLIMGRESANTTNSWLNLAKVLELTINDGRSLLSGAKLACGYAELGYAGLDELLADLETAFFKQLDKILVKMEKAANGCTEAIALMPVPFTSALMEGLKTGRDMRDVKHPGVTYHASGCLIHGLSVVADSLVAVKHGMAERKGFAAELLDALQKNFAGAADLREYLKKQPKYGNDLDEPDSVAVRIARMTSAKVHALRNPAGNPFLPDFSTPSTHLLYGYHVGATPDGRAAREMLGYGIDPRPENAMGGRIDMLLSERKLDYSDFLGGYAAHLGISPQVFRNGKNTDEKMVIFTEKIIKPLFGYKEELDNTPFYVYFNIDSKVNLRKVLENPKKYAPGGIYIMRIHGTFVNFLDLSPAIQNDIIARLDADERAS